MENWIVYESEQQSTKYDEDTEHLIAWTNKQPHLPHPIDVQVIKSALKLRGYNLEKAKSLIDDIHTSRTTFFNMYRFWNTIERNLQFNFDKCVVTILPKRTPSNKAVVILSLIDPTPNNFYMEDVVMRIVIILHTLIKLGPCPEKIVGIVNCQDLSIRHILSSDLSHIRDQIFLAKNMIKQLMDVAHVLNFPHQNSFIVSLLNMMMSGKNQKKMLFHSSLETLTDYFSPEMLPKEFGGSGPTLVELNEKCRDITFAIGKYMLENRASMMTDESKRILSDKTNDEDNMFGMQGSFKKILLD